MSLSLFTPFIPWFFIYLFYILYMSIDRKKNVSLIYLQIGMEWVETCGTTVQKYIYNNEFVMLILDLLYEKVL